MRTLSTLVRIGVSTALLAAGLTVGTAGAGVAATTCGASYPYYTTASLPDYYPRTFQVTHVQKCPIWKSSTPVYNGWRTNQSKSIVGYLNTSGWANWFVCREDGEFAATFTYNGYSSRSWAITKADGPNGSWGYVPAVFFAGSENYWNGLRPCTTYELP